MILFSDANGTIQTNFGTPVYQGSANSNVIYLIAPYAPAASVLVGFQLPDGSAVAPVAMTPLNAVPGVQNASGTSYAGWSYVLPAAVTAKYGTVTAQFFFYSPTGQSTNPTSIIATSATSFQVGRGAAAVLPDTPDADVYESILSNLAQLQTDLNGGYYGARAIFPWSNGATYGLNEITFYPSIGTYGAFVQSVVAGNTNNAPYVDGAINSAYWKEVVNFNTVTEDYFQQIQQAVTEAENAAESAQNSVQEALQAASIAQDQAELSSNYASQSAASASTAALKASEAVANADLAREYSQDAEVAKNAALDQAGNAFDSAQAAAQSATAAQGYAQQAQQYAQKHYQVVASVSELPRPGDSAFIYLVPTGSGTTGDSYSEYLWITESNDYEFIGTTADIDLSNYAQQNGTYQNMSVGKATADANGNNIVNTYATKAENNAKYTKPSTGIPESDLASAVQTSLGKADTAYQKPSGGIPKTDLASAVQTSLNKADTALQSVPLATSSAVGGVKPASKTSDMTQSVGVDDEGVLWTTPGDNIEYMTDAEVDALFLPQITSFSDATWQQIAQVSEAGTAQNYFAVGDEKTIELSTGEQVTLVILGFDHDDLTGGGKAGMSIGMKNLLATKYRMNASNTNVGGWDESEMRTSTMATLLSQLPSDLQSVIKQVNKKATAGGASTSITTSADKLWLFAEVEIDGTTSAEHADEGEQYEYWKTVKDGTVTDDRKKYLSNGSGSANAWWLRSPSVSVSTVFRCIGSSGSVISGNANNTYGVSFGFCV